jgi:hypothetical protein
MRMEIMSRIAKAQTLSCDDFWVLLNEVAECAILNSEIEVEMGKFSLLLQ